MAPDISQYNISKTLNSTYQMLTTFSRKIRKQDFPPTGLSQLSLKNQTKKKYKYQNTLKQVAVKTTQVHSLKIQPSVQCLYSPSL